MRAFPTRYWRRYPGHWRRLHRIRVHDRRVGRTKALVRTALVPAPGAGFHWPTRLDLPAQRPRTDARAAAGPGAHASPGGQCLGRAAGAQRSYFVRAAASPGIFRPGMVDDPITTISPVRLERAARLVAIA